MDLAYLKFYGLKEEPFSTVPSPRYLFLTNVHATALEKASYVVGGKKGLAAVFGDTGTGKSSLARHLHQTFLDKGYVSVLLTNPSFPTPYSLLRTITQEFATERSENSFKGLLDIFKAFLFAQAVDQGKTVVLLIDEAQTLRPTLIELLRQLVNYETNEMKLLQLVLFAQEELRATLARPKLRNFRSRIAMASTLERLSLDELQAMLTFRWQVASGGAALPFSPEAVGSLFEYAEGMPREANILADNSLLLGFYRKQPVIGQEIVVAAATDRRDSLLVEKGERRAA